jgi:hypothetical protein
MGSITSEKSFIIAKRLENHLKGILTKDIILLRVIGEIIGVVARHCKRIYKSLGSTTLSGKSF